MLVIEEMSRHTEFQRSLSMSEKHLVAAVTRRFEGMSRSERIAKIRKLAAASPEDKKFVRQTFPDLFREAFPSRRPAAGVRSQSGRRRVRSGAPR
jgi:hypothetical protein